MRFVRLLLLAFLVFGVGFVRAQVTSSAMTGTVVDDSLKSVEGAVIKATHIPSGTIYGTTSGKNGTYNIYNMRVGGPYKIEATYGGSSKVDSNIMLELGETFNYNVVFRENVLTGFTVKDKLNPLFNNQKTGASTVITREQVEVMPTVSRSILDFTRLTPQASGQNFMGRDSRYNNFQINGANFNNSFGLSSGFPGGSQPFSLDAVEQIQVAIAPYDVRQTNFTGANINVVTKSGTNDFKGSVYDYWRNEKYQGTKVGSDTLPTALKAQYKIYGFTFGGPIIKNKLFFFGNVEIDNKTSPGYSNNYLAARPGLVAPYISRTPADSLQKVSDFVRSKYGYETGAYENYANNFRTNNLRILGRIDYNIDTKNKLVVSFYQLKRLQDQQLSTSFPFASANVTNTARIGSNSMSFANSLYSLNNSVKSVNAELNSTISNVMTNQLNVSYTMVTEKRSTPGSLFPSIDIGFDGSNASDNYIYLGTELFSYNNFAKYNTLTFNNNLTVNKGIHNILAGVSYQHLDISNGFIPVGNLYYRYASLNDFITNQAPAVFGYSFSPDGSNGVAKIQYGLAGVYLQDKMNLTKDLVITAGLRVDMPFFFNKLSDNPNIDTLSLYNPSGNLQHYDAKKLPNQTPMVSPRIAFNWKPLKTTQLIVRGGTGIFAGQVPFVWITNQPGNTGATVNKQLVTDPNDLKYFTFATNFDNLNLPDNIKNKYFTKYTVPSTLSFIDNNFKMPKVWRNSIAVDYKIPRTPLVASAEYIYTKDIVAVYQYNGNLPPAAGVVRTYDSTGKNINYNTADSTRPLFANNKQYSLVSGGAFILANTNKGFASSFTIGIAAPPRKGFFGSLHYTHMTAKDASPNGGSQASSAWTNTPSLGSPNSLELSYSDFYRPHRVIGSLSYRFEYAKHLATTVTVIYEGATGGRFSYKYNKDINNDGLTADDLIYIPKNASELVWATEANPDGTKFTAQQQADAFDKFMNQDKYLNSHRGQYAKRNGAQLPYYGSFDVRLLQEVFLKYKNSRRSFQFSVDVLNFGNLLNSSWGVPQISTIPSGQLLTPGVDQTSKSILFYKFPAIRDRSGAYVLPTQSFTKSISVGSVWSMQLGLRFTF